ncbi:MAG: vWA domain-containing protein [Planctomycetota bacterium]|jgi:Ca-activated chloride channel family protein
MKVTGDFDFSSVVIEREQTLTLMAKINAPPAPDVKERKPLNIALVLDRSGSMGGDKIDYLKMAARQMLEHLTALDRLSIVIFDDLVNTVFAPAALRNKDLARAAIDSISARATTNLSGGWLEGLAHVESGFSRDALNRVLLLTDGLANQGVTDHDRLKEIASEYREKGISTTTLGFGADFDEDLLTGLAEHGDGTFYFIENPDDAPAAFKEELGEMAMVVGQNLIVEFRGRPPAQFLAVLNKYPSEAIENGLRIRVGDLFGDEQREIMAEMFVPGLPELGPREVGSIVLSVDQVVDPIQHHRMEVPVEINVVRPEEAQEAPEPEINEAATLLRISELRDKVIDRIKRGDFDEAKELIDDTEKTLVAQETATEQILLEIKRLREELNAAIERPSYGSKKMHYARYLQRSSKRNYRK